MRSERGEPTFWGLSICRLFSEESWGNIFPQMVNIPKKCRGTQSYSPVWVRFSRVSTKWKTKNIFLKVVHFNISKVEPFQLFVSFHPNRFVQFFILVQNNPNFPTPQILQFSHQNQLRAQLNFRALWFRAIVKLLSATKGRRNVFIFKRKAEILMWSHDSRSWGFDKTRLLLKSWGLAMLCGEPKIPACNSAIPVTAAAGHYRLSLC